jgi:hypothetical protein
MQFFNETDDTVEKRIGKVIGAVIVTIIYSGIAAFNDLRSQPCLYEVDGLAGMRRDGSRRT